MRRGFVAALVLILTIAAVTAYFYLSRSTAKEPRPPERANRTEKVPENSPPQEVGEVTTGGLKSSLKEMAESGVEVLSDLVSEITTERSYKPRPVKVYGTVFDAGTGEPISGALLFTEEYQGLLESMDDPDFDKANIDLTVDMTPEKLREFLESGESLPKGFQESLGAPTAMSDASGAYSITVESTFGAIVFCRAKGYAVETRETNQTTPEDWRVDFQLRKGASISGRVTDLASGEPVADVKVAVVSDRDQEDMGWMAMRFGSMDNTTTNADGTYTLGGLAGGLNQVVVRDIKHGWLFDGSRIVNVTLKEGEDRLGIDLVVSKGLSVQGTITNEKGEPVEGAKVVSKPTISLNARDPYTYRMKTPVAFSDSSGKYTAIGLRPGSSEIRVSHEDFADATAMAELAEGKETTDLNFTLESGVLVRGTAKRKDGKPALMVALHLSPEPKKDRRERFTFDAGNFINMDNDFTFTDEETGEFSFEHIPAGKYILSTESIGLFDEEEIDPKVPRVPIELDGKSNIANLEIIVPDEEEPFTIAEGKVTGTVFDRDGRPAANIGIGYVDTETAELGYHADIEPYSATKKDGSFELDLYEKDGTYTVYAQGDQGEASQANVKNGDNITLRLGPLTGVSGEVVDAEGNAVARCKVVLSQAVGEEPETFGAMMSRMMGDVGGLSRSASTDDFGQFAFKHIQPGDFTIEATSAGKGFGTSDRISISKGTEKSGVRIVLEAGVTFSGVVVDGSGKAVPGTNVSLSKASDNPMETMMAGMPADMMTQPVGIATSGVDGMFSMSGLKPGSFVLRAQHADFAPYTEQGVSLTGDQTTPHRVTLGKGGAAHGQFLVDGKPKPNMMIQLMGDSGMHMATTDSDGRFEVKGLPAGNYMVMPIDMDAMEDEEEEAMQNMSFKTVTITEGGDAVIIFGTGVAVNGTVPTEGLGKSNYVYLMRKGSPDIFANMSGMAPMEMMSMGMQLMQHAAGMAQIQDDGTFQLPQIDPGDYDLRVYASDMEFDEFDPDQFMSMSPEEVQAQAQQFIPKEIYKQSIIVGSEAMTVVIEKDASG